MEKGINDFIKLMRMKRQNCDIIIAITIVNSGTFHINNDAYDKGKINILVPPTSI